MENFVLFSVPETRLQQLVEAALTDYFAKNPVSPVTAPDADELGGLELAERITGYSRTTLYGLAHRREIPHSKVRGKLRFSRRELESWVKAGRRKTQAEIQTEAANFTRNGGKRNAK